MIKAHQYYFFRYLVGKETKNNNTVKKDSFELKIFFFLRILIGPSFEHIILTVSMVEFEILRGNFSSVLRVSGAVLSEEFVAWPEL